MDLAFRYTFLKKCCEGGKETFFSHHGAWLSRWRPGRQLLPCSARASGSAPPPCIRGTVLANALAGKGFTRIARIQRA